MLANIDTCSSIYVIQCLTSKRSTYFKPYSYNVLFEEVCKTLDKTQLTFQQKKECLDQDHCISKSIFYHFLSGLIIIAISGMAQAGHDLAMEAQEEHSVSDGIIKVIKRFVLKSIGWVAIYFIGYYEFSVAWLITPLLLTVLRAQWKSDRDHKLSAAREAALTDEKKMIESRIRVEDLPSWVFFPDKVSKSSILRIIFFGQELQH